MKTTKQHILLPTDFSDNAWNALIYVLKLYENDLCEFYFLHSISMFIPATTLNSGKLADTVAQSAKEELLELKKLAEDSNANANHNFHIILSKDALSNAIEHQVKKLNIDLVVMGTKGVTGAKHLFLGSNTVNVIKKMRLCPVLLIPEVYDFVVPKQIAFPTDFNRVYNLIEIKALTNMAFIYNSKIRVLHIENEKTLSKVQEKNMESLLSSLSDYETSLHWMPRYANLTKEINDFIEELNIDVLAMVNYKHSIVESLVNEPVIKKLGHHIKIPFLVIPS